MVKIAFHDNSMTVRGTTIALYDYSYYNMKLLGNESIIIYSNNTHNNNEVIEKFKKYFKVFSYDKWDEVNKILSDEKCDILYMIKSGYNDKKIADIKICKTIIHCVFNTKEKHGNIYCKISPSFGDKNIPVIEHMVNLPETNQNMRKELNIPHDAIVFGRYGGYDQFNIMYVYSVIDMITDTNDKIYFLFVNTKKFCKEKKNIIHLGNIVDLTEKVKFINTCDSMIHARIIGETFGCAVAEFSSKNKPVVTSRGNDNAHIDIMKDKCFIYHDSSSLQDIINNIYKNITKIRTEDWNAYREYTPKKIMDKFNEFFIKPL